jgi:hypothetical protein
MQEYKILRKRDEKKRKSKILLRKQKSGLVVDGESGRDSSIASPLLTMPVTGELNQLIIKARPTLPAAKSISPCKQKTKVYQNKKSKSGNNQSGFFLMGKSQKITKSRQNKPYKKSLMTTSIDSLDC